MDLSLHWNYLLTLEKDILETSDYIEFCAENYETHSVNFLKLNLAIGAEIDVTWKALSQEYRPEEKTKNVSKYKQVTNEDFPEIIDEIVYIPRFQIEFRPFEELKNKNEPGNYTTPFWWNEYNLIKHHRQENYRRANLTNLIHSFGALLLLNLYLIRKVKKLENLRDLGIYVSQLQLFSVNSKYKTFVLEINPGP